MPDIERRLDALRAKGWTLIEAPYTFESERDMRLSPPYLFERYLPTGAPVREPGATLEDAVARAEWQEQRISQLDNKTIVVHSGTRSA